MDVDEKYLREKPISYILATLYLYGIFPGNRILFSAPKNKNTFPERIVHRLPRNNLKVEQSRKVFWPNIKRNGELLK